MIWPRNWYLGAMVLTALLLFVLTGISAYAVSSIGPTASGKSEGPAGYAYLVGISPPLRDIAPAPQSGRPAQQQASPLLHQAFSPLVISTPSANWDGGIYNSADNGTPVKPPDSNGAAGLNYYMQLVNQIYYSIWDKTGTPVAGPVHVMELWGISTDPCGNHAHVHNDSVILYDQLADRWVITYFVDTTGGWDQCLLVSTSADPLSTWYKFAYNMGPDLPDRPALGMWPNGYYLSYQDAGPAALVFNRSQMLQGTPTVQALGFAGFNGGAYLLPASLTGFNLPPTPTGTPPGGTPWAVGPAYFVGVVNGTTPQLQIYQAHVDWAATPTGWLATPVDLPITPWAGVGGIPQPPLATTTRTLDSTSDKLMYPLTYRYFPAAPTPYSALVANHTVDAGGGQAGIRWYEVRNPDAAPVLYQQNTFSRADGASRWQGAIGMDGNGDIALAYNVSGSSLFPSIRYAGRLATDPLNKLSQGEQSLFEGTGSQVGFGDWGDYSALTLDPADDCTFWFTQEYNSSFSWYWHTRIGSFKFPACTPAPTRTATPPGSPTRTPTQTPTVTNTPTACPIQFTDVSSSDPFYTYIRCLACRGIVNGYNDAISCIGLGTPCFLPGNSLTRGQAAKIVANAASYNEDSSILRHSSFVDVPDSDPFWLYIERCLLHGVIDGYTDTIHCSSGIPCFLPSTNITRGELAKMAAQAANYSDVIPTTQQTFTDVTYSGNEFWLYIERLYAHGVISGYSTSPPCTTGTPCFLPGNDVTRSQASKIVANTFYPNCQTSLLAKRPPDSEATPPAAGTPTVPPPVPTAPLPSPVPTGSVPPVRAP